MSTPAEQHPNATRIMAAQYVRMSTEHQQYSTSNQEEVIRAYAERHGYAIIETYADEGRSGLRIAGRPALTRLLADVQSGNPNFKTILVYDVSRWGRFQDSDESAFYEYTCKRAGINVEYCAEQFTNDGSIPSTLMKSVKRIMAGEYSRELSRKVFHGQCRLIERGYRQGGPAGFGLRRMLIGQDGNPKGILKRGEHKSLQTDRVILVPGPEDEVRIVRQIYDWFTQQGMKEREIADRLNGQEIPNSELGRPWSAGMIQQVLTNEKYIGNNVYNRTSFKLKQKHVRNAPDIWVRANGVFQPIVDQATFFMARGVLVERVRRVSDDELLAKLRALYVAQGALSGPMIDRAEGMPSSWVYQQRFGSLLQAYALIGFKPAKDFEYLEINRTLQKLQLPLLEDIAGQLGRIGAHVTRDPSTGLMMINGEYSVAVTLSRCRQTSAGSLRWLVDTERAPETDITVVVRMNAENRQPVDFYLLPRIGMLESHLRLRETNSIDVETFQFDSLDYFVAIAARANAEESA